MILFSDEENYKKDTQCYYNLMPNTMQRCVDVPNGTVETKYGYD